MADQRALFQVLAGLLVRLKEKKCLLKLPASLALIWTELSMQAHQISIIKTNKTTEKHRKAVSNTCSDLCPGSDSYQQQAQWRSVKGRQRVAGVPRKASEPPVICGSGTVHQHRAPTPKSWSVSLLTQYLL